MNITPEIDLVREEETDSEEEVSPEIDPVIDLTDPGRDQTDLETFLEDLEIDLTVEDEDLQSPSMTGETGGKLLLGQVRQQLLHLTNHMTGYLILMSFLKVKPNRWDNIL